jgi:hypothetical protein
MSAAFSGDASSSGYFKEGGKRMLWLILGVILPAIAIAGGAIVHPVPFVLGILALFMFISGWRGRGAYRY